MKLSQIAVFVLAVVGFVGSFPRLYGVHDFAFSDRGWPLTVDRLYDEGLRPVQDYGYFYGLLPLVLDRGLFTAFGRTPETLLGIDAVCALLVAVGIVRSMRATNLSGAPAAFLAACTPFAVMPILFPSPAHAFEAALLANAMAFHLAGRPDRALALVTAAVFIKPSLGYVYGLLLLIHIFTAQSDGISRWRKLLPATVVGSAILATLVSLFGPEAVYRTQVPLDAMRAYRNAGFGFLFGSGREFWAPTDPVPLYHLLTPIGVWLASSVVLFMLAIRLLPRFRETIPNAVVSCFVLHAVFVFVLFGNQWSWIYYPYILFTGTAVGLHILRGPEDESDMPRFDLARGVAIALLALALIGQPISVWIGQAKLWTQNQRIPETHGMFIPAEYVEPWRFARQLGKSSRVFVLTRMGAASQIAPEWDAPRSWCLTRDTATPAEFERIRTQIKAADWVLVPEWHDNDLFGWPEFAEELRPFELEGKTPLYSLYRRKK